jgi:hypothetical protein
MICAHHADHWFPVEDVLDRDLPQSLGLKLGHGRLRRLGAGHE